MNSKHIIVGAVALAMGTAFTSCSHDFDYDSTTQGVVDNYNRIFIETFGVPAANQDWGFGNNGAARGLTRAVMTETWSGVHAECKFDESVFDMAVPSGAVDLTKGNYTDAEKNATAFYIPETFNGEVNFYAFNIPADAKIYNLGVVTGFNANANGLIVFYNIKTMTYSISSGSRHTVINAGTLNVTNYANIGDIYNKGTLVLERAHNPNWTNEGGTADVPDAMHIYSNGEGSVMMPDGGDLKAVCDIHGTLYVGNRDQNVVKNVKIQNSTRKYICGIDCTGKVENVDGPLETSYVKADVFSFDGNPIYLFPGGHVDITTLQVPNSGSHFYGAAGSNGLVEATNFEFGNKNDFTHTFSNNIYFKVNGGYIICDNCFAMGHYHYFNNVAEYLASDAHASDNQTDEYALAADRINTGNATGTPACGQPWSIDTPGNNEGNNEVWDEWVRIIVEDLSAKERTDFDFNDVVFDARINSNKTKAQIKLKAAGGTLPLTIGWSGEEGTSYSEFEVHNMYKVATNVMVNTQAKNGVDGKADVIKTLTGTFNTYNDIKVMVQKFGEWIEITANKGEPASKIQVTTDYIWCYEREQISKRYPNFDDYVGDPSKKWY